MIFKDISNFRAQLESFNYGDNRRKWLRAFGLYAVLDVLPLLILMLLSMQSPVTLMLFGAFAILRVLFALLPIYFFGYVREGTKYALCFLIEKPLKTACVLRFVKTVKR